MRIKMPRDNISVIIPVYNEERMIGACLESLANQSLLPEEVIVVDDGSIDKTSKILSEIKVITVIKAIKIIKQKHSGAGAARNLGVKNAKGEVLVFVDGDMRFHRTFLEDLTEPIRNGKSRGTFSKMEFIANWNNVWARFWNYRRGISEPRAVPENYPNFSPVFRAILKSEFERVGGFDEKKGYNDDWSLSEKLGYKATEAKAVFYHNNPDSLLEAIKQARWEAKRKYKLGIFGGLGNLGRGLSKLVKIEDSLLKTVFYLLFLILTDLIAVLGMIEYYWKGRVAK